MELPLRLLVAAVVVGLTVPAIHGGLNAYETAQASRTAEVAIDAVVRVAQRLYLSGGGAQDVVVDLSGGVTARVEYVRIGDTAGGAPARQSRKPSRDDRGGVPNPRDRGLAPRDVRWERGARRRRTVGDPSRPPTRRDRNDGRRGRVSGGRGSFVAAASPSGFAISRGGPASRRARLLPGSSGGGAAPNPRAPVRTHSGGVHRRRVRGHGRVRPRRGPRARVPRRTDAAVDPLGADVPHVRLLAALDRAIVRSVLRARENDDRHRCGTRA